MPDRKPELELAVNGTTLKVHFSAGGLTCLQDPFSAVLTQNVRGVQWIIRSSICAVAARALQTLECEKSKTLIAEKVFCMLKAGRTYA